MARRTSFSDQANGNRVEEFVSNDPSTIVPAATATNGPIRHGASSDWRDREGVRAELRVGAKAILKFRKYPPDKQESASELALEQAELFTDEMLGVV